MENGAMDLDAVVSSDDSDYEIEDAISSTSSEDDDMDDEDLYEPEEPLQLPSPANMSVEELAAIIQEHQRNRTVRRLLLKIDTDSDLFRPRYSCFEPTRPEDDPPLVSKNFGTVLHFACRDEDGARGTQKIRIILDAARQAQVDIPGMLSLGEVEVRRRNDKWIKEKDLSWTPLRCLLFNDKSTVESVRLICTAWPGVVNVRCAEQDCESTTLMDIVYDYTCNTEDKLDRLVSMTKVLLQAAERTTTGARGLVSATQVVNFGLDSNGGRYVDLDGGEITAVHIAARYQPHPERFLSLLLRAWPDALKFCSECTEHCGSFPLHDIAKLGKQDYESSMKSLAVILNESTLEAIAAGLLLTDQAGDLGFHRVQAAVEGGDSKNFKELQANIQGLLKGLVYRKDQQGRTLLHYVAANLGEISPMESKRVELDGPVWKLRQDLGETGWRENIDPTPQESELIEKEREKSRTRNAGYIQEVCRWILSFDASLAFVQDNDGLNPFHFAMRQGKQWSNGVERLVEVVPDWPRSRESTHGLYPFMLAASFETAEVNTIYELLRFVGALRP